jgi:hypothetical protein
MCEQSCNDTSLEYAGMRPRRRAPRLSASGDGADADKAREAVAGVYLAARL